MAEWSKALESGCYDNLSSPKGRGFEPHFCHHEFLFLLIALRLFCLWSKNSEKYFRNPCDAQRLLSCHSNVLEWEVQKQKLNVTVQILSSSWETSKEGNSASVCRT